MLIKIFFSLNQKYFDISRSFHSSLPPAGISALSLRVARQENKQELIDTSPISQGNASGSDAPCCLWEGNRGG